MLTNIEKTARRRAWTFAGCAAALAAFALSVAAPAAHADPPRHAKAHGYYKNKNKKGDRGQYRNNHRDDYRDDRWRDRDRDGIRDRDDRYPNDPRNGGGFRRDRDQDNDRVRNRRDRDRDGVRNKRDRFPNSLRRP